MARWVVSGWLAAGVLPLAACAVLPNPPVLSSQAPAQVGSSPPTASSASGFSNGVREVPSQSEALTDYLHRRRLPLVGAHVLAAGGGPRQVILYGFVATAFGKADAADRAREFLNDPAAQVQNRIKIAPELANRPETPPPPADDPGNDLKAYQDQQLAGRQLRQYQNQGSAGMVPLLPLLGLFSSFSSGGMGYGFGGSPFGNPYGGYGSGWGAYPSYPMYPQPPGIGYSFPYSPIFP